jgi:hypothetical protein
MISNGIQSCTLGNDHIFVRSVIGNLLGVMRLHDTAKDMAAVLGGEPAWAALVVTMILKDLIWGKAMIAEWMVLSMMNLPSRMMALQMKNADLASRALKLNMWAQVMEQRKFTPLMHAHQAHIHPQDLGHHDNVLEDFTRPVRNAVALEVQPVHLQAYKIVWLAVPVPIQAFLLRRALSVTQCSLKQG